MSVDQIDAARATTGTELRDVCYERLWRIGTDRAVALRLGAEGFASRLRRSTLRRGGAATAADDWLTAPPGGDDALRRAGLAALTLGLEARAETLPAALRAGYPAWRERVSRRLRAASPYDDGAYDADVAVASGAVMPIGPFYVRLPPPPAPETLAARARHALGAVARLALAGSMDRAIDWIRRSRLKPWAELHLDIRALSAFNADGFVAAYAALAELMRMRPDLAGVRAASWLYDPKLARVTPELAFVRRTAETRGAVLVKGRTASSQSALAGVRSPARRRLIAEGAYRPACWMLFWSSAALLDWADGRPRPKTNLAIASRPQD